MSNLLNNAEINAPMIAAMVESGKTYTAVKGAMLALDMVADSDAADAYLASIGVEKNRKRGFADNMNAFLMDAPVTQADFFAWLKANGSASAWKLRTSHDNVRRLSNAVHAKYGTEITEVLYVEETKADPETDSEAA